MLVQVGGEQRVEFDMLARQPGVLHVFAEGGCAERVVMPPASRTRCSSRWPARSAAREGTYRLIARRRSDRGSTL